MRDSILLIALSVATLILTLSLNLNPLAALPGVFGVVAGTLLVRLSRAEAHSRTSAA